MSMLAFRGAAGLGLPYGGVGGGEEFFVLARGGVDEPAVAGGIGVEGDGLAGGLAEGATIERGYGHSNVAGISENGIKVSGA